MRCEKLLDLEGSDQGKASVPLRGQIHRIRVRIEDDELSADTRKKPLVSTKRKEAPNPCCSTSTDSVSSVPVEERL